MHFFQTSHEGSASKTFNPVEDFFGISRSFSNQKFKPGTLAPSASSRSSLPACVPPFRRSRSPANSPSYPANSSPSPAFSSAFRRSVDSESSVFRQPSVSGFLAPFFRRPAAQPPPSSACAIKQQHPSLCSAVGWNN